MFALFDPRKKISVPARALLWMLLGWIALVWAATSWSQSASAQAQNEARFSRALSLV